MSDEHEFGEVPRLVRLSGPGCEAITTGQYTTLQKQFERMGIIIEPVPEKDQTASEAPIQDLIPTEE